MHLIIDQQMVLFYKRALNSSNVVLATNIIVFETEICQFTDVFV